MLAIELHAVISLAHARVQHRRLSADVNDTSSPQPLRTAAPAALGRGDSGSDAVSCTGRCTWSTPHTNVPDRSIWGLAWRFVGNMPSAGGTTRATPKTQWFEDNREGRTATGEPSELRAPAACTTRAITVHRRSHVSQSVRQTHSHSLTRSLTHHKPEFSSQSSRVRVSQTAVDFTISQSVD